MSYMLLIVEPVGQRAERGVEAGQQVYQRMLDFGADLQARGLLEASNSLASTRQAVRLQVREGRKTLIDGPFAEAKEMIGGFFLLKNIASREEALAIAAACPAAEWATVELRRVGACFDDAAS
ncbi:MAG: YciI family protein [Burkholderiaceae bacterium]